MRVILDTNVLVSAAMWTGNERKLWQFVLDGTLQNICTYQIFAETATVLHRKKFSEKLSENARSAFLDLLIENSIFIALEDYNTENDEHVIQAAIVSGVPIVTGDAALRKKARQKNISASSSRNVLDLL